jgi:hypothetical protein
VLRRFLNALRVELNGVAGKKERKSRTQEELDVSLREGVTFLRKFQADAMNSLARLSKRSRSASAPRDRR